MRKNIYASKVFEELLARKLRIDWLADEANKHIEPAEERMTADRLYRLSRGTVAWVRFEAEAVCAALGRPYSELFPPDVEVKQVRDTRGRPRSTAAVVA